MEATHLGQNRTGAAVNPKEIDLMLQAVRDLSPQIPISTLRMDVERQSYITEADSVGSIPPPKPGKATLKRAATKAQAAGTGVFLDKLGERIAFERTGTRLYGALITKYLALINAGHEVLPPVSSILSKESAGDGAEAAATGESAIDTLQRIRAEELGHFHTLCELVKRIGGDPTAQTPCADVTAAASIGLMQVITDPRTTLAQCLNTILTAELTDNAGWELLSQLAEEAGQGDMVEAFSEAIEVERQHLVVIRGWLKSLLMNESGTPAV
jgi:rubrerythrin